MYRVKVGCQLGYVTSVPTPAVFMVQPADSSRPRHLGRPVEIETDAAMLHYSTESGHLQRLIAQGTARRPLLLINGLDLPLVAKSTTDTLLIHGSDWLSLSARKAVPAAIAKGGAAFARH